MTETDTRALAQNCRAAARILAHTRTADKNAALLAMADALMAHCESILEANRLDLESAHGNLSDAKIDRLRLDRERLQKMADALHEVAALDDPVGRRSESCLRPSGIRVARQRIPLGVILMIYESRPNVTSDAAGLCLKAGNGVILRGGSEAFHSNQAIVNVLQSALDACGLPAEAVSFVADSDRSRLFELLKLDEFIDLVIPRGGEGLIRHVVENSRIPVIKHYKGVCHLYVDESADLEKAIDLLIDGKTSRPGVCNALETLLVHRNAARAFLPLAAQAMHSRGVELRGCKHTRSLVPDIAAADESDYEAEYLDLILAVRVVDDLDAALNHIARYGSDHTDVIVTQNLRAAERFLDEVDSSVTAVNASSRFSDGGELGLGAEIGISTTKLHAFGPMGLEALTTQKFIVVGDGQIRHPIK